MSAAQRGGEPDKALSKTELAEKTYLSSLNKLAVALDGEKKAVNWVLVNKVFAKSQEVFMYVCIYVCGAYLCAFVCTHTQACCRFVYG